MDTQELKVIMASLYGFTATQLVQQVSAINALERTLEDIKKGASWQSLDLCIDSAISTLEIIKNTRDINSERSEKHDFPMSLDQFHQILDSDNHPFEDLIVTIKYKYDFETDYIIENQFLEYDGNHNNYIWLHDWQEGQTDVTVLGYIPVSEVSTDSECSENTAILNIDRIRTMTAKELAYTLAHRYFISNTDDVYEWLMSPYTGFDCGNFERSEKYKQNNIDYIRSLTASQLADKIKDFIILLEEGECGKCPFNQPYNHDEYGCTCSVHGITEWLLSERSEKEGD